MQPLNRHPLAPPPHPQYFENKPSATMSRYNQNSGGAKSNAEQSAVHKEKSKSLRGVPQTEAQGLVARQSPSPTLPPPRLHLFSGCQLATMALQIKTVTIPKRWVALLQKSSPNLGRHAVHLG